LIPNVTIGFYEKYEVFQCNACNNYIIRHRHWDDEDRQMAWDPNTGELDDYWTDHFYPEVNRIVQSADLLPEQVCGIYKETLKCESQQQSILWGMGIRAIIEAVCLEKKAEGKDFKNKIDRLAKAGYVTPDGATILHDLRFLGNKAAHEIKAHSSEELSIALDIIDYLIYGVYVLPKKAARIKAYRENDEE
jgi:hypothetical protein